MHKRAVSRELPLRLAVVLALAALPAAGLNPARRLSQYAHTVWTQAQGLPQDTVRSIVQDREGALWIGTDEGLARFDGFEFKLFTRNSGSLPSNSVTALAAAADGSVWVGTTGGLARYRDGHFQRFGAKEGLPSTTVTSLSEDGADGVWVAAGLYLSHFDGLRFTNWSASNGLPMEAVRTVLADGPGGAWVGGYGVLARYEKGKFATVLRGGPIEGDILIDLMRDHTGRMLLAGTRGIVTLGSDGAVGKLTAGEGLANLVVRCLVEDKDGVLWVGTNSGLARRVGGRIEAVTGDVLRPRDWVWSLLEDREGDLWVGTNNGLHRFRDQRFTVYTRAEGLPGDQPTTVRQDSKGVVWVGFHDNGLAVVREGKFIPVSGPPSPEVFCLSGTRHGDVLVGTRGGLTRFSGGAVSTFVPSDAVGRHSVFDVVEDAQGRLLLGTNSGVLELSRGRAKQVVPGGPLLNDAVVALLAARDGTVWAGTYGKGLWRIKGGEKRLLTTADGLPANQVRSLLEDPDGTLWIGTFGGGLAVFRDGRFRSLDSRRGLPSDNVSKIIDEGDALWLATTRGLARIEKADALRAAASGSGDVPMRIFGTGEGLKTAQCAPGYPVGGGGTRTADGRIWFPTTYGLAVLRPSLLSAQRPAPAARLEEVVVDGRPIDFQQPVVMPASSTRIQFRYTAILLGSPERIRFRYRLDGLDRNWIAAETRRVVDYTSLPYGHYRFRVSASDGSGGPAGSVATLDFYRRPHLYERRGFLWASGLGLAMAGWLAFRLRLRQVRHRFSLVVKERARLAREIHDTLAQGFVGISSQLDAVALMLPAQPEKAAECLGLARKMAQHSLTEARRSVMDLRAQALEDRGLLEALAETVRTMAAGHGVKATFEAGELGGPLPRDIEHQLLRIVQEAVANALKHADAREIRVRLMREGATLRLLVSDDGRGFDPSEAFRTAGGRFGLLGMRERAQRAGGTLELTSGPGTGTTIEVTVRLA
jgi:signal transduction histidine kinase/ligand-binding sensor domain-containing protein